MPSAVSLDLRISLSKLELFCLAAELQSFGRAAEQSFITQPVMTSHMRSLAERLGADLFVRDGNRMVLTQEGRVAYEWARDALARARTTFRQLEEIREGTRGSVAISACSTIGSYMLPEIVADFTAEFPDVDITLHIGDLESTLRGVEVGERDFALMMAHPQVSRAPTLTYEEIGHEELILVGPCGDDGAPPVLAPHEVAWLDVLAFPQGSFRQQLADWFLGEAGMPELPASIELGSTEAMKRAVRRGLGVAFLFRSSVSDELERGELQELRIAGVTNRVPIYVIQRSGSTLTALQRRLLDSIRAALAQTDLTLSVA